jgi:hypothetical protein
MVCSTRGLVEGHRMGNPSVRFFRSGWQCPAVLPGLMNLAPHQTVFLLKRYILIVADSQPRKNPPQTRPADSKWLLPLSHQISIRAIAQAINRPTLYTTHDLRQLFMSVLHCRRDMPLHRLSHFFIQRMV